MKLILITTVVLFISQALAAQTSTWERLGSGLSPVVRTIAVGANGVIYAGGSFDDVNGAPCEGIAFFDGTSWDCLGGGVSGGNFPEVMAILVVDTNEIYIAGRFDSAGVVAVNSLAKWNGVGYESVGGGTDGTNTALGMDANGDLYVGGGFQYAGGSFQTPGAIFSRSIARWNGSQWFAVLDLESSVDAIAINGTDVYVGGEFLHAGNIPGTAHFAKWDGTAWSSVGGSANDNVTAIAVDSSGNVYAGGLFTAIGGTGSPHIAKFDGTSWSSLGGGVNDNVDAIVINSNQDIYLGGAFYLQNGDTTALNQLAFFDGTTYSSLNGSTNTIFFGVNALALTPDGDLVAGGSFNTMGGLASVNQIALWKVDPVLDLKHVQTTALSIYPNPVEDKLHIDTESQNPLNALLYTVDGKLLLEASLVEGQLDVSTIPEGMYLLHLQNSDVNEVIKIQIR